MDLKSFDAFAELLKGLSNKYAIKPPKDDPWNDDGAVLITPAIFEPNKTRANANVTQWGGWCALDIDDYKGSYEDALKIFAPFQHIVYSSASSREGNEKFRVVLPTSRWVEAEEIRHFWFALNKEFNSLGDKQTKDLSRMYYVPANYPDAKKFFIHNREGEEINPDALMKKHKYAKQDKIFAFPESIQKALAEYKMLKCDRKDITWTSFRDCPFVNRKMLMEYQALSGAGWYSKLYSLAVSIAGTAIRQKYPITAYEVADLLREIDASTGGWYKDRPLETEAQRAIDFVLTNQ